MEHLRNLVEFKSDANRWRFYLAPRTGVPLALALVSRYVTFRRVVVSLDWIAFAVVDFGDNVIFRFATKDSTGLNSAATIARTLSENKIQCWVARCSKCRDDKTHTELHWEANQANSHVLASAHRRLDSGRR